MIRTELFTYGRFRTAINPTQSRQKIPILAAISSISTRLVSRHSISINVRAILPSFVAVSYPVSSS